MNLGIFDIGQPQPEEPARFLVSVAEAAEFQTRFRPISDISRIVRATGTTHEEPENRPKIWV